jgi:hypothetical protein
MAGTPQLVVKLLCRSRNSSCPESAPGDGQRHRIGEIKLHRTIRHQGCPRLEIV